MDEMDAALRKYDPQVLIPPSVRSQWAVVPRFELYQLFGVGVLVGAGAALSIVGFQTESILRHAWGIALVLMFLQNLLLRPRAIRRLAELRAAWNTARE